MVAFDTASETFHAMAPPPPSSREKKSRVALHAMDGLLVAADLMGRDKGIIDLWFLEDYSNGRWELRHRIDTAPILALLRVVRARRADDDDPCSCWQAMRSMVLGVVGNDDEGDVILRTYGRRGGGVQRGEQDV